MCTVSRKSQIAQECWDKSLHCWGTAELLRIRANFMNNLIKGQTYAGVAIPVFIGMLVLCFNFKDDFFYTIKIVFSILNIPFILFSLWTIVWKWQDGYITLSRANDEHLVLSEKFKDLAHRINSSPIPTLNEIEREYDSLKREDEILTQKIKELNISECEKRYAMRFALRQFQRECVGCGQVPKNLISTDCPVCGQFKFCFNFLGGKIYDAKHRVST
ncbi:MAG: hypothetical protein LBE12_00390 [Planctomycetaceae bacterium]|jgi:mobilome CxxCx(11)CxxC protein|nr:hypothetical protein [Planctomycetaceae bacterium]